MTALDSYLRDYPREERRATEYEEFHAFIFFGTFHTSKVTLLSAE